MVNESGETDNSNFFTSVLGWFSSLGDFLSSVLSYINPLSDNFFLSGLFNLISTGFSYINPFSENFIFTNLFTWINNFFTSLGNFFQPLWSFITNLLSWFNPLSENFFAYKFIDLLKNALSFLFIPSEERINGLINTFTSKFEFIDSIKIAINSMKDMFNNIGNAPSLHLSLNSTKYTPAGNYTILDFSWYAPYKNYGDLILTGFIYIAYLWRLFITIPNIINGTGGSTGSFVHYVNADLDDLRD